VAGVVAAQCGERCGRRGACAGDVVGVVHCRWRWWCTRVVLVGTFKRSLKLLPRLRVLAQVPAIPESETQIRTHPWERVIRTRESAYSQVFPRVNPQVLMSSCDSCPALLKGIRRCFFDVEGCLPVMNPIHRVIDREGQSMLHHSSMLRYSRVRGTLLRVYKRVLGVVKRARFANAVPSRSA
jgi:hypothetical protein